MLLGYMGSMLSKMFWGDDISSVLPHEGVLLVLYQQKVSWKIAFQEASVLLKSQRWKTLKLQQFRTKYLSAGINDTKHLKDLAYIKVYPKTHTVSLSCIPDSNHCLFYW